MAYSISITRTAGREYRAVVDYLADTLKSKQAARHFVDEFDRKLELVAERPCAFGLSHLPELAARGYRSAGVLRYVFLYKVSGDHVIVAHVFHQSQDYARLV